MNNNGWIGLGWFVLCAAGAAALLHWFGIGIDGVEWIDIAVGSAGLIMLYGILRYPWDLYLEARGLAVDQREGRERDIEVSDEDVKYAKRTARQLLFVCVGAHFAAAGIALVVTRYSDLGYWFAGFFLLATILRPAATMYAHLKTRLLDLRRRTRFPREDVVSVVARVEMLETSLKLEREARESLEKTTTAQAHALAATAKQQQALTTVYDQKIDRVCREMTRSVEKLTDDKELLGGLRAFVRMVKET